MAYLRERPRITAKGRAPIRLTPAQRDLFLGAPGLPENLGHLLHRAVVRRGKLSMRVTRAELDDLIAAAAAISPGDRAMDQTLAALLRYLEGIEDRFEQAEGDAVP